MVNAHRRISGGLVVLFEGTDGVGKTTQLQLAAEALRADGWQVHTTRNLGGTPMGEALRTASLSDVARLPETDLYISAAIQNELVDAVVAERRKGAIVLIDRGPLSLFAYQVHGSGASAELGWDIADTGIAGFHPDVILLFKADISTSLGRARLASGKADYFESKPISFFERVAVGLAAAGDKYGATEVQANTSIEDIHQKTMEHIHEAITAANKH